MFNKDIPAKHMCFAGKQISNIFVNNKEMTKFIIHGARGGMPVCGRDFVKYGGATSCFSLRTKQGLLVIDAGTGILALADALARESRLPPITFVFTHFHLDHVIGLPFFKPIYRRNAKITIMGSAAREDDWRTSLRTIVSRPYWPVELPPFGGSFQGCDLPGTEGEKEIYGIRLAWLAVSHPQQCLALRLQMPGCSVVIATDREQGGRREDKKFLEFCRGTDFLIFDGQYTAAEYPAHRGWGHSTWQEGVKVAQAVKARQLIITHHDTHRTDKQLDALVKQARRLFPRTRAASSGMVLSF